MARRGQLESRQVSDIIESDVAEAAEYVGAAWRQGVESIVEIGRRLIEIRERFHNDRGKWSRLIGDNQWNGQGFLPFGARHDQRLVAIAEDTRLPTHVSVIPSATYTLYQLTRLSDERFTELLEDGRIIPA